MSGRAPYGLYQPLDVQIWYRIKRPQPDAIEKIDLPQTATAQPLT